MSLADQLGNLPPRLQHAIAVLVVPMALLAISASLLWPALDAYRGQIEWRSASERALSRQRGLAAIEIPVREQLDALPRLTAWQRLYRGALGSATIALQSDISSALGASHARPQSFTPIPATREGPLTKVGLRVTAVMTIDQLRELLQRMDTTAHFVRIEHFIVVAPPVQTLHENPQLTVTLEVFGFHLGDEPTSAATSPQSQVR